MQLSKILKRRKRVGEQSGSCQGLGRVGQSKETPTREVFEVSGCFCISITVMVV